MLWGHSRDWVIIHTRRANFQRWGGIITLPNEQEFANRPPWPGIEPGPTRAPGGHSGTKPSPLGWEELLYRLALAFMLGQLILKRANAFSRIPLTLTMEKWFLTPGKWEVKIGMNAVEVLFFSWRKNMSFECEFAHKSIVYELNLFKFLPLHRSKLPSKVITSFIVWVFRFCLKRFKIPMLGWVIRLRKLCSKSFEIFGFFRLLPGLKSHEWELRKDFKEFFLQNLKIFWRIFSLGAFDTYISSTRHFLMDLDLINMLAWFIFPHLVVFTSWISH